MNKILITAALVLLCQQAFAAPPSTKVSIMVRTGTEITGSIVKLCDIASVKTDDAGLAEKLKGAEICTSPLPGENRQLTRAQIMVALRKAGVNDKEVDLLSPETISITRSAVEITGEDLFNAAKDYVLNTIKLQGTISVEPVRTVPSQQIPVGKVELKVQSINTGIHKGQNSIPVNIQLDGNMLRKVFIPVQVKVLTRVLIATESISKGEELSTANTKFEEREITSIPYEVLMDMPEYGCIASMPISQGSIIRKNWVCEPPVVKSGDNIMVVVQANGVRIADKGIAAEDGRQGERIKVRFPDGRRELRATVMEPGMAHILSAWRN